MKKERKKRSIIWKIGSDKLREVVENSSCFSDILKYFGLQNKGGNYKTLRQRLDKENIEYAKHTRYRKVNKAIPLEEIMVEGSTYSRGHLKRRLIKQNVIPHRCEKCGLGSEWQGEKISLVLDHRNGVSNDHRKENLRFLCPNCNSQTATFAGRRGPYIDIKCIVCGQGTGTRSKYCNDCKKSKKNNKGHCIDCGKEIFHSSRRCEGCAGNNLRKVVRPNKTELHRMLWEEPTVRIAERYGVSDRAVGKWAESYGVSKPPRGYWAKQSSSRGSFQ